MKSIVAFLQNPWFKPGTDPRNIKHFQEDQEFRKRVICLSRTGKLLYAAFGEDLYDHIWWDEANMEPCFTSSGVRPPNIEHITNVISSRWPEMIITFGAMAGVGVIQSCKSLCSIYQIYRPRVLSCCHPTARGKHRPDLLALAKEVRNWLYEPAPV